MTRLIAIRHGRTDWNDAKKLQGTTNIPLNAGGIADVESWSLPDKLGAPDLWISSPLARAKQTAGILAPAGTTIITESRLREMSFGTWEGRTLADLRAELGPALASNEARGLDFCPDDGESPRDVINRLRPFFVELARDFAPDTRLIVCVCHKAVIRAMMAMATDWDMTVKAPVKLLPGRYIGFDLSSGGVLTKMEPGWLKGIEP